MLSNRTRHVFETEALLSMKPVGATAIGDELGPYARVQAISLTRWCEHMCRERRSYCRSLPTYWKADIEPRHPKNQPGARRTDDRRVISGIVHVLKTGCRWQDCPPVYGPPTTIYNRFRRWTMRGLWRRLFETLAHADPGEDQAIDSTTAKAHRSAAGGKGGRRRRRKVARAGRTTKIHATVDAADAFRPRRDARPSRRRSGAQP